jgi:hypothetical protein
MRRDPFLLRSGRLALAKAALEMTGIIFFYAALGGRKDAFGFSAGYPLGEDPVKSQAQKFGGRRPTNGLTGLGIEPLVGRRKPEAALFFGSFLLGKQKK